MVLREPGAELERRGETIGRRRLLQYFGTAATVGTGLAIGTILLDGSPAAATHTDGFGHTNNTGVLATYLTTTGLGPALSVNQTNATVADPAVKGRNDSGGSTGPGVEGSTAGSGPGVRGFSSGGPGLRGSSATNNAVEGTIDPSSGANGFNAVFGVNNSTGNGVFGEVTNPTNPANAVLGIHQGPGNSVYGFKPPGVAGDAVVGLARGGRGVHAASESAIGVEAQGGRAPLLLVPAGTVGAPGSEAHVKGELFTDSAGTLWSCVTDGTPGTWRQLAGAATAGAFHVLGTPQRVNDSRPGTLPSNGPKTPLTSVARPLDLKVNSSGVPAGATAALVTCLLVNAVAANANFTIWANGAPKPLSNSLVWGPNAGGTAR